MDTLKKLRGLALLFSFATVFYSCSIEDDFIDRTMAPGSPDLATKVTASLISGFVTDENDNPVQGAAVEAGGINTSTDKYGYFEIKNAVVVQTAATVSIQKQNYFKTVRTFIAAAGKGSFFRVKLMARSNVGTISGTTGGTISLANGFSITLPANATVIAGSNTPFTGTINVYAKLIRADDPDVNSVMPGDLRGLNTNNAMQVLTTYGMVAIELLNSSNGTQALQLAAGKKATLTIPIPAAMQAAAPASIPLWYFDETKGLWQEEGGAVKTGNAFVGEVSHFTFWNCDWPSPLVQFDATVVGSNGLPLSNVLVRISLVSNPYIRGYGYTDANGYISGAIPVNSQLQLQVYPGTSCSSVYTQNFTTGTGNYSFGTITMTTPTGLATLSGNITDCNNNPLAGAHLILIRNGQYYRFTTNNSGAYTFNTLLCGNPPNTVTLVAEDAASSQQSTPLNYTLNAGTNNIPTLQACGLSNNIFIHQVRNGVPYNLNNPPDTIKTINPGNNNIGMMYFADPAMTIPAQIIFSGTGIGVGSDQTLIGMTPYTILNPPVLVHITEYGLVGQFIAGNFTGNFSGPNNLSYNITCSFRIRRTY